MLTPLEIERIIESFERLAAAWDSIAHSLAGINVSIQKFQRRYAPEPRSKDDARDAVVTRVPTEEDLAKEAQGASSRPISEWFDLPNEEEEEIGPRERQLIEERRAKTERERGQGSRRVETSRSEPTGSGEDAADNSAF